MSASVLCLLCSGLCWSQKLTFTPKTHTHRLVISAGNEAVGVGVFDFTHPEVLGLLTAGCRDPARRRSRGRWRPSPPAHLTDVKHSVCDVHEGFPHAARRRHEQPDAHLLITQLGEQRSQPLDLLQGTRRRCHFKGRTCTMDDIVSL